MAATFHLGLSMAGAISAGAYSAGAFDFLMEALEAWEARRRELEAAGTPADQWDIPNHRVVIPVMSGASAGGITGALGLLALADAANRRQTHRYPGVGEVTTTLPRLYDAWVRKIRFVADDGGAALLGTADLERGHICALLDTTILDEIAQGSLTGIADLNAPRPYLAQDIHLFLTHSSIRGVPYLIPFSNDGKTDPGYGMQSHGERRHFTVHGVGTAVFASPWAGPDPAVRLDVAGLRGITSAAAVWADPVWRDYGESALGTSAFPVGLRARPIDALDQETYERRQWPVARFVERDGQKLFRLKPNFPDPEIAPKYLTLDGGMINNEPFELARWTLLADPPTRNPRDPALSDRAVLMIDPFPAAPTYETEEVLEARLRAVVGKIFPTLVNQARFKPDDLADALDETVYSRFLISPRRRVARGAPLEEHPISCGLLGGFGGFLAESFRAHDYQLGRLNCYLFLRDDLAFPLNNPVVGAGYAGCIDKSAYAIDDNPTHYPLIPLVGSAREMPAPPTWPRVDPATVDEMVEQAMVRAEAMYRKVKANEVSGVLPRMILSGAWGMKLKGAAREFIRYAVLKDLILRDQLTGPTADAPEEDRRVIAALADARYDLRSAGGIADDLKIGSDKVAEILRAPAYADLIHRQRYAGRDHYALRERRPGRASRTPGLRQLREWAMGHLKVD